MSPADVFQIHAKYLVKWKVFAKWINMPCLLKCKTGFFPLNLVLKFVRSF